MFKKILFLAVVIFLTLLLKKLFYFPFTIKSIEGFSNENENNNNNNPEIPDVKRPYKFL